VADLWYSSEAALPPFRAPVRVQWNGRVFIAVRTMHPKKGKPTWATFHNGDAVFLPPKGRSRQWGENPQFWQPENVDTWKHELPSPVRLQNGVSWETVDTSPRELGRPGLDDWWRDATHVRYSPQGEISMEEAEARLMRAICTGWTITPGGPRMSINATIISRLSETRSDLTTEYDHDTGQFLDADKDWRPPFRPTGADQDDFLVALSWFAALNPVEFWHKDRRVGALNRAQKVLCSRAMDPPLPWVYLGQRFQVTDERMRQVYKESIEKVWRAANGMPVFRHLTPVDQMAALRGRNRDYAQRGRGE
jgi:hypothetical protein